MKPPVRLVAGDGARPRGFDAVLRAMAELADVRSDADGPVLSWRPGCVVLGPASIELPALLVNLDGDRPMLPFLRARARRMRGLDDSLRVEAGHPLMHLARWVDASAATTDRDLIRALATGAIVVGEALSAVRLGLDPALVGPAPADERAETARSAAATRAVRRFDPRSVAVELMNGAGIGGGSVRHAVVELHGGALDRIDGRVARLVGTKGMGAWA